MKKEHNDISELGPSRRTGTRTVYAALHVLAAASGPLPRKRVMAAVEAIMDFSGRELRVTGRCIPYWSDMLDVYSHIAQRAGLLSKSGGWSITKKGRDALATISGPVDLYSQYLSDEE